MKFIVTVSLVLLLSLLAEHSLTKAEDTAGGTEEPPSTNTNGTVGADANGTAANSSSTENVTETPNTTAVVDGAVSANDTTAITMSPEDMAAMNSTEGAGDDGLFGNVCEGGFDAASFVGGMVLCGGTLLIVYFACKYYQSRLDQDYATIKD